MRDRLLIKLFLAQLASVAVVVAVVLLLARWSIDRGFVAYLNEQQRERVQQVAATLAEHYGRQGGWELLIARRGLWRELTRDDRAALGGEGAEATAGQRPLPPAPGWGPPPGNGHPGLGPGGHRPPEGYPGYGFGPPPGGPGGWAAPGQPRPAPAGGWEPGGEPPRPPGGWQGDPDPAGLPLPPGPAVGDPLRVGPRLTLFDGERQFIVGRSRTPEGLELTPIRHADRVVGWLGVVPLREVAEPQGLGFLRQQSHTFYGIAAAAIVVAALGALLLSRRLLKPVQALAGAARTLAGGEYQTRVKIQGGDELARLGADFNHLAATLEANESARRRWIADISHELRTPLAVLRGEIEALQDGVRPLTPEALASLHAEVRRLGKLIEDLYQLALADLGALSYHMAPVDPVALVLDAAEAFAARYAAAGLTLVPPEPGSGPTLMGDADRLSQLFHNLLENSLRYTDRGGRLVIGWERQGAELCIDFSDSAPGVAEEALPRLFDRLFRTEGSRNRAHGGAGLGLAICANIAAAHQGQLQARPSPLGGLWVRLRLRLPVSRGTPA